MQFPKVNSSAPLYCETRVVPQRSPVAVQNIDKYWSREIFYEYVHFVLILNSFGRKTLSKNISIILWKKILPFENIFFWNRLLHQQQDEDRSHVALASLGNNYDVHTRFWIELWMMVGRFDGNILIARYEWVFKDLR